MKCRVMAEGASYELTEKSLASAQIKSCRHPLEIRLPLSSQALKLLDTGDFVCKMSNYCVCCFFLQLAFAYCRPNVTASPAVQLHFTFTFLLQTLSVVPRLPIVFRQCALAQMLMLCLLCCRPSAALRSRTVFPLSSTLVSLYTFVHLTVSGIIVSCRANAKQV